MRGHGRVDGAQGLGPSDHVCWVFDERDEFVGAAIEFLADGIPLGQRLIYVGDGDPAALALEAGALPGAAALQASGQLVICPLEGFCDPDVGVVVEQQLAFCQDTVGDALRAGFTGVRFAAEVTRLAAAPRSWENHVRWEQVADAAMQQAPLAALCGYDRAKIATEAAAALSCVHPLRSAGASPAGIFQLDGHLHIEGEVDSFSAGLLRLCAPTTPLAASHFVIDAVDLEFIDAAATSELARLDAHLNAYDTVEIRNAPHVLRRIWDILDIDRSTTVRLV